jgi:hypothetical protein
MSSAKCAPAGESVVRKSAWLTESPCARSECRSSLRKTITYSADAMNPTDHRTGPVPMQVSGDRAWLRGANAALLGRALAQPAEPRAEDTSG